MGISTLSLFSPEVSSSLTLSEKLGYVFNVAVIGFAIVFIVLSLIWGILELFNFIFGRKNQAVNTAVEDITASEAVYELETGGDEETVAAIVAAISVYTAKPASSFRVVSFRKSGKR